MTPHISEKENLENAVNTNFISAIKELGISSLLGQCGIRKDSRRQKGEPSGEKRIAFEIFQFQFLLLLVFQGCNLYRFPGSKKQDIACSKNTYNRFLNDCHYNWRRFITLLAARVVAFFDMLTCDNRFKELVIDDSVISRNRSKRVELLAFIFDHVTGKSAKGFNLLTIGWTDGYSFIPVAFNMLSSAKPAKRLNGMKKMVDKRTNGFKNRVAVTMKKPDAEIIRRYGYRWFIECCYKVCKSLLKLGKEFQPVNYDTTVSSTALVFTRFIILEWLRHKQNDQKTVCEK